MVPVDSKTTDTPISYQVPRVVGVYLKHIVQKVVKQVVVFNHEDLCDRNTEELEGQSRVKKGKHLFINTVDEIVERSVKSSFGT